MIVSIDISSNSSPVSALLFGISPLAAAGPTDEEKQKKNNKTKQNKEAKPKIRIG